jgi:hypothetical protein
MTSPIRKALAALDQNIDRLPGTPVIVAIVMLDASGNRIRASSGPPDQYRALADGLSEAADAAALRGHPQQPDAASHAAEISAERIALALIGRAWLSSRRAIK